MKPKALIHSLSFLLASFLSVEGSALCRLIAGLQDACPCSLEQTQCGRDPCSPR